MAMVLEVARRKSGNYTVRRPLEIGAAMSGCSDRTLSGLGRYGTAIGEAFQLRDDILGVFGDPAQTGKPAGDDLREGKRTVLVALTLERATTEQAKTVETLLGDPALDIAGVELLRSIIVETGALDACEKMIDGYTADAKAALAAVPLVAEGREAGTSPARSSSTWIVTSPPRRVRAGATPCPRPPISRRPCGSSA